MKCKQRRGQAGFSLIELVIVVVIIGIIGAIAIPRMSRGASGAADSALTANLSVLRNAIDLYAAEHGGDFPAVANIADQLTQRTDGTGAVMGATDDAADFPYGPYLRAVPPLPVGTQKGEAGITATLGNSGGWYYEESTGNVSANTTPAEADESGTLYSEY